MRDGPVDKSPRLGAGKRAKASLILLAGAVAVVLFDIAALVLMMCVRPAAGSILRLLGDEIAAIVFLSMLLMLVLSATGALLGMLEWRAAGKAPRRPSLMAVAATYLNLALLVVVLIVGCFLWNFDPMPPT